MSVSTVRHMSSAVAKATKPMMRGYLITKKLNSISTTTEKETEAEEVNFFADMEPVIKPTTNLLAMSATAKAEDTQPTVEEEDVLLHDKFAIHAIDVDENEVGWSDIDADGAWSS